MNQATHESHDLFDPSRLLSIVEVRGFAGALRWHHVVVCYVDEALGAEEWMTAAAGWLGVGSLEVIVEHLKRPLPEKWATREALEKFIELRMTIEEFKNA